MSEKNSDKKRIKNIRQKNVVITLVSAAALCDVSAAAIIFQVNHLTVPGTEEETTQDTEKITVPQTEPIMETESPAETESPGKFDSMEYYSATAGIQTVSELAQAGYVFSSQDYVPDVYKRQCTDC